MGLVVGIVSIIIIVTALFFVYGPYGKNDTVLINWQMKLTIHDTNTKSNLTIPANIGVQGYGLWNDHRFDSLGPPGYAPLSTRDTSGTIYISFYASPSTCCPFFTFGDFFSIWGQTLNGSCVGTGERGTYCQGREDDPTVKFVDQDNSGSWSSPEPVVVDGNGNSIYDPGEQVLSGQTPAAGSGLKDDPRIMYTDGDNYGTRDPNEAVVYDSDGDYLYRVGEPVIYGATPSTDWSLVRPWPFMSDGDKERCLDRGVGLSNGKDWIIIIWATLGDQYCTLGGL